MYASRMVAFIQPINVFFVPFFIRNKQSCVFRLLIRICSIQVMSQGCDWAKLTVR